MSELDYQVLTIVSVPKRFRRAGMAFSHTPTDVAVDDLTQAQYEALVSEPNLKVDVTVFKPDEAEPKPKPKPKTSRRKATKSQEADA